jgi:outer membrane lipoprotein SlyB
MKIALPCLLGLLLLSGCAQPDQNRYDSRDVGMNATVLFGKIISERQVQITGNDTGTGTLAGGVGGGVAGSLIGAGKGSVAGALVGAVAGGFLGNSVEQNAGNRMGIEYIIAFDNGTNQSIVQNAGKDDRVLVLGQRVMVQTQGSYRRVLPAPADTVAAPPPSPAAPPATP